MAKKKSTRKKGSTTKVTKVTCESKGYTCSGGSAVYCLGFVGALVYYISVATGFWNGVWGIIKALLWPAFLVYELLKFLGM